MEIEKPHIDQNALSRQLAVYGHEAQGKLMSMRVFINGITGVRLVLFIAGCGSRQEFDSGRPQTGHYLRSDYCRYRGCWPQLLLQA